jgi:colanic acid biosynthesis glycosyl transferase WcaI
MRILLVGINYAPDLVGVAKYNTELCESLVADGHEVQVITAPPYYPGWKIPADFDSAFLRDRDQAGVTIHRVPIYVPERPSGAKRLLHHASFALMSAGPVLVKALQWRPEVMISIAPSLMSAAFVSFVARTTGAKSWLHLQDFEIDAAFDLGLLKNKKLRAPMLAVERQILKSFDRVSTISPQMLQRLASKGIDPGKLREIRNWIDTAAIMPGDRQTRFREELNIAASDLVGLYSGTMSNKQGLELIIDAAARLEASHPHIKFIMCGQGPFKVRLMELASSHSNIQFIGLQPNERFSELLATADFHVIPQKAEAADLVLPSKLGGILSSNRPVIAMAAEGTALADEVRDVGLVVAPGDVEALAAAICRLDSDRQFGDAFGNNGRKRALERWDRRAIVDSWTREMASLAHQALDGRPASLA